MLQELITSVMISEMFLIVKCIIYVIIIMRNILNICDGGELPHCPRYTGGLPAT